MDEGEAGPNRQRELPKQAIFGLNNPGEAASSGTFPSPAAGEAAADERWADADNSPHCHGLSDVAEQWLALTKPSHAPQPRPRLTFAQRAVEAGRPAEEITRLTRLERLLKEAQSGWMPVRFDPQVWKQELGTRGYPEDWLRVILECKGVLSVDPAPEAPIGQDRHDPNHGSLYVFPDVVRNKLKKEQSRGGYPEWPGGTELLPIVIAPLGAVPKFANPEDKRWYDKLLKKCGAKLAAIARADLQAALGRGPKPRQFVIPAKFEPVPVLESLRVVHDLRRGWNDRGPGLTTHLPAIHQFMKMVPDGAWLMKRDQLAAFKQRQVLYWETVAMAVVIEGQLRIANQLPFGANYSPGQHGAHQTDPLAELHRAYMRERGVKALTLVHVDDHIGVAETEDAIRACEECLVDASKTLDIPLAEEPDKRGLGQELRVLGLDWCTQPVFTVKIPEKKLSFVRALIGEAAMQRYFRPRELQSVLGMIAFIGVGIRGARPHSADLWTLVQGVGEGEGKIFLPEHVSQYMKFWAALTAESQFNGVSRVHKPAWCPPGHLQSDASGSLNIAIAMFGAALVFFLPPEIERELAVDIAKKELVAAILLSVCTAAVAARESLVALECAVALADTDNLVVMNWLNAQRSPKRWVNNLLRFEWKVASVASMEFQRSYIRSEDNVMADAASRLNPALYLKGFNDYIANMPPDRPNWWPGGRPFPPSPTFYLVDQHSPLGRLAEDLGSDDGRRLAVSPQQVEHLLQEVRGQLLSAFTTGVADVHVMDGIRGKRA